MRLCCHSVVTKANPNSSNSSQQLEHCIIELPRVRSCFVQAGGPIFADEHFVYFQAQPDFVRKPMNRWPMAGKL
jgi:hypothetical protein